MGFFENFALQIFLCLFLFLFQKLKLATKNKNRSLRENKSNLQTAKAETANFPRERQEVHMLFDFCVCVALVFVVSTWHKIHAKMRNIEEKHVSRKKGGGIHEREEEELRVLVFRFAARNYKTQKLNNKSV